MTSIFRLSCYLFAFALLFTSCSSRKYAGTYEQQKNTTFVVSSNVPDFQVSLFKKNSGKSLKLEPTKTGRNSKTYTLNKLKFYGNHIRISADNYESQDVKVKIIPRGEAVKADLLCGLITYFVPLIIDPFRSDFYKIAKRSKNIEVELRFSQYYMDKVFSSIASSSNVRDFNQFISKYPHSNKVKAATDKKDLLELNAALQADSEEALTKYITSHPNSNYLEKAEEYKREMKSARLAYNKLQEKGDLGDYISYLEKYPDFKQSKLVIKEGLILVSNEQKSKDILQYYEGLFLKYGDILTTTEKKEIREKVNSFLENQLLIQVGERSSYESLKSMWNNALQIRSQYEDLTLNKILYHKKIDIAHLFLKEFAKMDSERQQKIVNSKYVADFPEFSSEIGTLFLVPAVTYNKEFNGTITLMNQDFLSEYNNNSSERDPLKEFCCGSVVGDKEELVLKGGGISSYKIWDKKAPVAYFERSNNDRKFTRFTDGKLVEENFFSYSTRKGYKYIYENGVNTTLRDLDDKIDEVKKRLIQNDPRSAKSYIEYHCGNNFPESLSQNIEIRQLAKKCDDLIAEIEAREEKERRLAMQAELARQEKEEAENEAERLRIKALEREKAEATRITIKCTDLGDYPEDYAGKNIKVGAYYSAGDNKYYWSEKVRVYGYGNLTETKRHSTKKSLGQHSKEDIYNYKEEKYYYRTFSCSSGPNISAWIPVGLRVPNLSDNSAWLQISGKFIRGWGQFTSRNILEPGMDGWDGNPNSSCIIVSSIERL